MRNPELIENSIKPIDGHSDSLYICCSSYEERSALSVRKLSLSYKVEHSFICRSIEYANKGNATQYYQEITDRLDGVSLTSPLTQPFEIEESINFVRALDREISKLNNDSPLRAVTVDITTFPREELLLLLRYLDNHTQRGRIRLLYGEPDKYATEDDIEEDRWLTRGVKSVHPVPGFGGIQFPGHPKILVIILGHEGERTHISVRRHQPDIVVFIPQGQEQHHEGLREISEQQNQDVVSLYGGDRVWGTGLPSRGVLETAKVISEIYAKYRYSHNVFIVPNGTKLQLLGLYLVARRIPEIQITYAVPSVYNWAKYTTGTKLLWEIVLESPSE